MLKILSKPLRSTYIINEKFVQYWILIKILLFIYNNYIFLLIEMNITIMFRNVNETKAE